MRRGPISRNRSERCVTTRAERQCTTDARRRYRTGRVDRDVARSGTPRSARGLHRVSLAGHVDVAGQRVGDIVEVQEGVRRPQIRGNRRAVFEHDAPACDSSRITGRVIHYEKFPSTVEVTREARQRWAGLGKATRSGRREVVGSIRAGATVSAGCCSCGYRRGPVLEDQVATRNSTRSASVRHDDHTGSVGRTEGHVHIIREGMCITVDQYLLHNG